jgi:predicted DNA-binding transcriptional regulator YafY
MGEAAMSPPIFCGREEVDSPSVVIDYTNWRGERSLRVVEPKSIFFGKNEWHREPQWLLSALDVQKKEVRTFALASIHSWRPADLKDGS